MSTLDDRAKELLARPSLEALSYILRRPEYWPEGFKWDYYYCHSCAMGVAFMLWDEISAPDFAPISKAFGISKEDTSRLFGEYVRHHPGMPADKDVLPTDIADWIDAYLATRT